MAEYDKANQAIIYIAELGVGSVDNKPHFPLDTEGTPSRLQLSERPEP